MSNLKKQAQRINRTVELKLRDMTPSKREQFQANVRTLVDQGNRAREMHRRLQRGGY